MPSRPRRNAAAVASLRMEDAAMEEVEYIDVESSVDFTPPSPKPVRLRKLKVTVVKSAPKQQSKVAKVQKKQKQKKAQEATTPTTSYVTVERRPNPSRGQSDPNDSDDDSLTEEMRGRLLPFILTFDNEEQDRIRPGSRSACYLDSDDEAIGVYNRERIVYEEATLSDKKKKRNRKKSRTTGHKKKAQAPSRKKQKKASLKSRYIPLTVITTNAKVYASESDSSSESEGSFASDPSTVHSFTPPSPSSPPLGPFDRGKLHQSRKKIRATVGETKTTKTKLSFSSPATTASKAKGQGQKKQRDDFDFEEDFEEDSDDDEDEIPARKSYLGLNPPVLKRSAAYLQSEDGDSVDSSEDSCDGSDDSDVSFANVRHARKRNSQTPRAKSKAKRSIGKSRRR
ncbi:hypothetical protein TrVE_jg409 [Triparma verrucosa]|uniref:Uncharacterized protein n=1 Tax=Triparma verrucosa TaxID=1606542 RepID=A0A9W7C9R4_9STRA|nr:hypothetical protein TrVE_jg409 [Triparma verrucosa]